MTRRAVSPGIEPTDVRGEDEIGGAASRKRPLIGVHKAIRRRSLRSAVTHYRKANSRHLGRQGSGRTPRPHTSSENNL